MKKIFRKLKCMLNKHNWYYSKEEMHRRCFSCPTEEEKVVSNVEGESHIEWVKVK